MASKTLVLLEDDIDGSEASRTINFAWEGQALEIDLNEKNATAFEKAVKKYVDHARKATAAVRTGRGRATSNSRGGRTSADKSHTQDVRRWANENGFQVQARGRIPAEVQEAYDKAHAA